MTHEGIRGEYSNNRQREVDKDGERYHTTSMEEENK